MKLRPLRRGFPGQSTYRTKQTISETVSTSVFHSRFNSPQILRENAQHLREKFKEIIRSPKFNSRSEAYVERWVEIHSPRDRVCICNSFWSFCGTPNGIRKVQAELAVSFSTPNGVSRAMSESNSLDQLSVSWSFIPHNLFMQFFLQLFCSRWKFKEKLQF